MTHPTIRNIRRRALALTVVALAIPATAAASPPTEPPDDPVLSTDAAVIAQGIVEFPGGGFQWSGEAIPAGGGYTIADSPPTFWLALGPDDVRIEATSTDVLLGAGEGSFVRAGSSGAVSANGEATAWRITFVGADGGFVPGPARRDVELRTDTLAAGEALQLESELPAYLLVAAGTVRAGDQSIVAGAAAVVGGTALLTNSGREPAVVAVGVIGAVTTPRPDGGPAVTTGGSSGPGTGPAPASTSPGATTTTPAAVAPNAVDDSCAATGAAVTCNVLANDMLGDPAATITAVLTGSVGETIGVGAGTFVLDANGTATYSPTFTDINTQYTTTYTITNASGSSTATVVLDVTAG